MQLGCVICYKSETDETAHGSLFAEATTAHFTDKQVLDLMFSDAQEKQVSNDFEEEDVSEEDGEEYNACIENTMHHFRMRKKIPQTEGEIFFRRRAK